MTAYGRNEIFFHFAKDDKSAIISCVNKSNFDVSFVVAEKVAASIVVNLRWHYIVESGRFDAQLLLVFIFGVAKNCRIDDAAKRISFV